jgi:hypothetical protein
MSATQPLVPCPNCGRLHHAARGSEPHYCSIACYRAGTGLDDPATGDGRHWCPGCSRYINPDDHRHWCSPACRVADWRRRQPPRPLSPAAANPETKMRTVDLADVITEHAPAPYTGDDSDAVIDEAVATLGTLRGLQFIGDAGAVLHLLASLGAQINTLTPAAIVDAHDQDYSWSEIAALTNLSRDRVQRLAAHHTDPRRPLTD